MQRGDVFTPISDLDTQLTKHFDGKISTAPFLTRKIVSFQGNKEKPAYRWYKYKEAFSASLAEYFLCQYKGGIRGTVLDPFAGIGTTLFAASSAGLSSDGIELLPIGQEVIRARLSLESEFTSKDRIKLEHWIRDAPWKKLEARIPLNMLRITEGAYPLETVEAIERYLSALQAESAKIQTILRFALLCILESVSFTRKDGQYLRWDHRSNRQRGSSKSFDKGKILEFGPTIAEKLREILFDMDACDDNTTLFPLKPVEKGCIHLFSGSCLNLMPTMDSAVYGAILTSPPYCNRYDYTRTYALELAMLGMSHEDVINLRQEMLSCTVENREKNLLAHFPQFAPSVDAADHQELLQLILAFLESEKANGRLNNSGIPRMVKGYFYEMACVIGECSRVLKPNARLFMVNDNVRYSGVSISVDLILSQIAEMLGFDVENILVIPSRKGNSSQQMGAHGREPLRKCVYIWKKK
jgi:DNA modification methylase